MRYSYEYKRKCVELYRQSKWPETPEGIKEKNFRIMIRRWARIEDSQGPESLQHKMFFASLFCIKLQKVFVGCCTYIL